MTNVPCGGCRTCCIGEKVELQPDEIDMYHSEVIDGHTVVKQHIDGSCVYLGREGCMIHELAPKVCRDFDCRQYFLSMTRRERRVIEKVSKQHGYPHKALVLAEGRKRLDTLPESQRKIALSERKHDAKGVRRQFECKLLKEVK